MEGLDYHIEGEGKYRRRGVFRSEKGEYGSQEGIFEMSS